MLRAPDLQIIARRIQQDCATGIYKSRPLEAYRLLQEASEVSRFLTATKGTRALDILHIAAARLHGAKRFLSFDNNQRQAAHLAGLQVRP